MMNQTVTIVLTSPRTEENLLTVCLIHEAVYVTVISGTSPVILLIMILPLSSR